MVGTRAGGIKIRDANLAKNPLYYQIIGAKGGLKKVPKGFAINRELARTAGAKGGKTSSRNRRLNTPFYQRWLDWMRHNG